jgi:DNA-directed RNA polymerase subunit alpha
MKITIELDSLEELKLWADFSSKSNLKEKQRPLELDSLDLNGRTLKCLSDEKIYTVEALLKFTENQLLRMPNFGRKSLNELKKALARNQLHLRFA